MNKTLTQSEREEPGMILAVIKSVLDSDWADILDRTPDIKTKSYDEISEVMLAAFLEKHPLVVQRINAMRIVKEKDFRLYEEDIRCLSFSRSGKCSN